MKLIKVYSNNEISNLLISKKIIKILLLFPDNVENTCVNFTLSIRVDFQHVCVSWSLHHLCGNFTIFSCDFLSDVNWRECLFIHIKLSLHEVKKGKINIEWTHVCLWFTSKSQKETSNFSIHIENKLFAYLV